MRYVYGMFQTRDEADDFLFQMWGSGDVGNLQKPRIEKRGNGYAITLAAD